MTLNAKALEALKPCPFCGGHNVILRQDQSAHMSWVSCVGCGLEAPSETGVGDDDAVIYWNRRALSSLPHAGVSEEMVELCSDCPPIGYPTDETRCLPCPRRVAAASQQDEAVPVAWRYWLPNAEVWALSDDKDEIDELRSEFPNFEIVPLYASPVSADAGEPTRALDFFTNVDTWGAAEWFDRLAKAIREQDKAVVAGDDLGFETYRNIASSSAMRLVRDYEQVVRSALAPATSQAKGSSE